MRRGTALLLASVALAGVFLAGTQVGAAPAPTSIAPPQDQLPEALEYRMTVGGGLVGSTPVTVDIEDWYYHMMTPVSTGGATGTARDVATGRSEFDPIEVEMDYEKALTLNLARQEAGGGKLTFVLIEGYYVDYERGETVHLRVNMTNVYVSEFTMAGSSGNLPTVTVEFTYLKIEINGGPSSKGTQYSWDLAKNKPS